MVSGRLPGALVINGLWSSSQQLREGTPRCTISQRTALLASRGNARNTPDSPYSPRSSHFWIRLSTAQAGARCVTLFETQDTHCVFFSLKVSLFSELFCWYHLSITQLTQSCSGCLSFIPLQKNLPAYHPLYCPLPAAARLCTGLSSLAFSANRVIDHTNFHAASFHLA